MFLAVMVELVVLTFFAKLRGNVLCIGTVEGSGNVLKYLSYTGNLIPANQYVLNRVIPLVFWSLR